ncbi:polysaccharide pyruvyl transferase WcaK-like protein [Roseimicrobium gellanilyticum]|uniref:Polysaccharide pyruvyl transferase WcaK-like protein n=1 Tax=Roseimicrobium gellanilyticum TaxID=748857 RepID=A0A366HXT1_9BACT|nr:polysaccharide pyruvyl transferase family protein [Roseimicrobium gellanilyticum]RBP48128.1 polysaccharide pyruvyl transferase WcaK-like protein [Roseimicrobium gellanilyticum]
MVQPRKNVVFSTTRQWNPGDEIILLGILNLFRSIGADFNPIIFNRHPDITPPNAWQNPFRKIKQTTGMFRDMLAPWLRLGHHDNSWKFDMDPELCDLFVFAGTPEWSGRRLTKIYDMLDRHSIPAAYVGIGCGSARTIDSLKPIFARVASHAISITARDSFTQQLFSPFGSVQLPCPSLFAVRPGEERTVTGLKRICLIHASDSGLKWQRISPGASKFITHLYKGLIEEFGQRCEVEVVCHYIDELPEAQRLFPGCAIRYDYDAARYLDLYRSYDLVIGPRVHGIGAAASAGVPGILIAHDGRADTAHGFQAHVLRASDDLIMVNEAIDEITATAVSLLERASKLRRHKADSWVRYRDFLAPKIAPYLGRVSAPCAIPSRVAA